MAFPENPVPMAVIGAAHGIKGELRVKSFTEDPVALGSYGPLSARDGRTFTVASARAAKDVVVVRFKEVPDRNTAETLTGVELFIDRSKLPEGEEDEFYHADLVGLGVRDLDNNDIGKVRSVQNFGGGDLLEVRLTGQGDIFIPFTAAAVPEVLVRDGYVRIDLIAAGLVDEEDDQPDQDAFP